MILGQKWKPLAQIIIREFPNRFNLENAACYAPDVDANHFFIGKFGTAIVG